MPLAPVKNRSARQRAISKTLQLVQDLPDPVRNILQVLEQATPEEHRAGRAWYATAHSYAQDVSGDVRTGAGILAALSPQLGWVENVELAYRVAAGEDPHGLPCLSLGADRAGQILQGADPAATLGGRKVRSFFANILRPFTSGAVTVDRHAVAIAFPDLDSRQATNLLERIGGYQYVAAAYRSAARATGLLPLEIQAITWLTYRRLLDERGTPGSRPNLPTATPNVVDF